MKSKYPTEEEQQAYFGRWMEWFKKHMEAGDFTGGKPIADDGKVVGRSGVSDLNPSNINELVSGYAFVNSDSIDAAAEIAKGCPGLEVGQTVEVRQTHEM